MSSEATPPGTEQRKDVNTRKVIEVLSAKFDEKLEERLKSHVTWPGVMGASVALLGLVATLVFTLTAPVKSEAAAVEVRVTRRQDRTEDADAKRFDRLEKQVNDQNAAVQAIKDVVVEGKARREALEEFKRKTKEK